tara:strand:+ start:101 stop:376 length:276 start_codon:yes stop_codon:yes gene_type:complete
MVVNGTDIVEQLRGRMRFYHVGDRVRVDMERACEEIVELRLSGSGSGHTAASVGAWLDAEGVKLLPWQRKRLGLAPTRTDPEKQRTPESVQ